jgi:hypothetical protein
MQWLRGSAVVKIAVVVGVRKRFSHQCVCGLFRCLPSNLCPAVQAQHWGGIIDSAQCLAPYQGSSWETIDLLLDVGNFKPGDTLLDIGAGDGRIMIRAIQRGAAEAIGWELRENVYEMAVAHINAAILDDALRRRVTLHLGDASNCELSNVTLVSLFLLPDGLKVIAPLLHEKLRKIRAPLVQSAVPMRIVSAGWPLPGWTITKQAHTSGGTPVFAYHV